MPKHNSLSRFLFQSIFVAMISKTWIINQLKELKGKCSETYQNGWWGSEDFNVLKKVAEIKQEVIEGVNEG